MLDFNWGIFWALLVAFALRRIYRWARAVIRIYQFNASNRSEITLRHILGSSFASSYPAVRIQRRSGRTIRPLRVFSV